MSSRVSRPAPRMAADVLVLDTDRSSGQALAAELSAHGLSTLVCDALEEAAAKASTARVLLVRRRLGTTDAFAFARELKKKLETPLRLVILAEAPNAEDALRAIDVSALGIAFEPHAAENLARRIRRAAEADPAELMDHEAAPVFRVRRGGVVYKMKARPELLVEHLLQATEAMGARARSAEGALAPSSDTSAIPVEHRTGAFLVVREDRQVLFANPAARALLALPDDLGRARFEEPMDVQRVIEKKIKSGRRSLDVVIRAREMIYEGEKALGVSVRDVTELRNIVSQLRLSNEILDRVPAVVLVADPDGRVAYAGPGVNTLLGYDANEAMGESFWTLAWERAEDAARMRAEFVGTVGREGAAPPPFEARLQARDGSPRILAFQIAMGPGGNPGYL